MLANKRMIAFIILLTMLPTACRAVQAQSHNWQPQPDKAALMVISCHPDDEGIFFGGVIPYYTQVRQLPMVHISMTSGDWQRPPEVREEELRNADWVYGLRNEPLFPRFKSHATTSLDQTWDVWADGVIDGDDIAEGREAATRYVAEQIRRYQPDVIVTHDIEGEYGHIEHRASSLAVIDAWALAADSNVEIAGLAAYQPEKLYIHQSEANGLGTPGYTFENWLFHDYLEEIAIDTDGDDTADSSPRDAADAGLDEHVSQGSPDVSTVYRTSENYDGHHSEWWGLYASTVGPDSLAAPFEIEGADYTDWARGDFLQHIDLSGYYQLPGAPGDVNLDGIVSGDGSGPFESDDVTAFVLGWGTTGHLSIEEKWAHGDMTLDGFTNLFDWHILRTHHEDPSSLPDLHSLLAGVPEPSGCGLLLLSSAILLTRKRRLTPFSQDRHFVCFSLLSKKESDVVFVFSAFACIIFSVHADDAAAVAVRRPNIVFILADDVGREVLGCYGGSSYRTPNLDRLSTTGARFEHCYSMPVCHPTRVCLLTGRYPRHLGNPNWGTFPKAAESQTFAHVVKRAGYATAIAGKWQICMMKDDPDHPRRLGFDEWSLFGWHEGPRYHDPLIYENGELRSDTQGKYGPDLYVDFLADFMQRNKDRPFLAFYSMALCHDVTDDLPEPVPYGPRGRYDSYQEMADQMDVEIGRLVDAIDALGIRENTLILFTTDNGTAKRSIIRAENGEYTREPVVSTFHGKKIPGGKTQLTDWGTRVPLIANWQGVTAAGQVRDELVDFSDLLPTFAELTGGQLPEGVTLDGHSFAGLLTGRGTTNRRWAYAESRIARFFAKTQRWKLYNSGQFFDTENDPDEQHPISAGERSAEAESAYRLLSTAVRQLNARTSAAKP